MGYKNMTPKEYHRIWWQNRKEKNYEVRKKWIENNPERWRASQLLNAYRQSDKKANRGKGNLTIDWIIENIFSKPCAHCGKTGWDVVGCNRINNDLPHTMDNVEPCCKECNNKALVLEHDEKGKFKKIKNEAQNSSIHTSI